jgi:hypothetical protein
MTAARLMLLDGARGDPMQAWEPHAYAGVAQLQRLLRTLGA